METFKLSIFKGHELKQTKEVAVNSKEELKAERNINLTRVESPLLRYHYQNWMGVKRINHNLTGG